MVKKRLWSAHRTSLNMIRRPSWPTVICETDTAEGWCALQFYETGLVDPKLWPFGDDLRERFELTRVSFPLATCYYDCAYARHNTPVAISPPSSAPAMEEQVMGHAGLAPFHCSPGFVVRRALPGRISHTAVEPDITSGMDLLHMFR